MLLCLLIPAFAIPAEDPAPPEPADNDFDGWAEFDDCDDFDATVYPTALEICDGKDNDCDGDVDESAEPGVYLLYVDADGDGFGLPGGVEVTDPASCPLAAGYALQAGDCDDNDDTKHPGATDDQCDGIDDDCDYLTDDDAPTAGYWYYDTDGDGHAGGGGFGCSEPGAIAVFSDCNDDDPTIHVDATEVYGDGIDQDCNGLDDPWPDADGDGFDIRDDCDDLSVSVNPDATEACGNNVDDDCDGSIDEECTEPPPPDEGKGCSTGASGLLSWAVVLGLLARRRNR